MADRLSHQALHVKKLLKDSLGLLAANFGPHRFGLDAQPRLWVLMYHRILPRTDARFDSEEPGMIVTPESFRQHLRTIKKLFEVLPLSTWVERRAQGKSLPRRACAVTFDDGWLDNLEYALPILQQEQVPATVFAVADMVGTPQQFWPNRLARLLTTPGIERRGESFAWLRPLRGYSDTGPLSSEAIAAVIDGCKRFSDPELAAHLERMETASALPPCTTPALMDWPQLQRMQDSGLVEIGSHTRHHYRLAGDLPAPLLQDEIAGSRAQLERMLEKPVKLFCYPNGDVSRPAAELVGKHYLAAVTTQRGINSAATPDHMLSRIGVHEHIGATDRGFQARLSGWM